MRMVEVVSSNKYSAMNVELDRLEALENNPHFWKVYVCDECLEGDKGYDIKRSMHVNVLENEKQKKCACYWCNEVKSRNKRCLVGSWRMTRKLMLILFEKLDQRMAKAYSKDDLKYMRDADNGIFDNITYRTGTEMWKVWSHEPYLSLRKTYNLA